MYVVVAHFRADLSLPPLLPHVLEVEVCGPVGEVEDGEDEGEDDAGDDVDSFGPRGESGEPGSSTPLSLR